MATQESTVEFIVAQVSGASSVRARKMFGEYALYCNNKVVALICDDRLFLKPTEQGRAFVGTVEEAQAYPGSSLFLLIDEDRWEDREWITELIRITELALPVPKPKKAKKK